MRTLRVATRRSALALVQTNHVVDRLRQAAPKAAFELVPIRTRGDEIVDRALSEVGGKGLFVADIEEALASGQADLAVHSMKDVPFALREGLVIGAVPRREDPRDALISRTGAGLFDLPAGARVGTSSLRRQAALRRLRPDLQVETLRGNVDTRLRRLDEGQFDAIVLAASGLHRLGLAARITSISLSIGSSPPWARARSPWSAEPMTRRCWATWPPFRTPPPPARWRRSARFSRGLRAAARCPSARTLSPSATTCASSPSSPIPPGLAACSSNELGKTREHSELASPKRCFARAPRPGSRTGEVVDVPRPGVLITQSGDRGLALAEALRDRGFRAEHVPLIETVPLSEALAQVDRIAQDGEAWAFTSAAAVRAIASHARAVLRLRSAPAVYAVGEATWRAVRALAPQAVYFPSVRGAQDFAARLIDACDPSVAFVIPRGRLALETLPEALRRAGRRVMEWIVYDTVLRPEAADRFAERAGDVIALFSPSAVAAIAAHPSARDIFAPGRFLWLPLGETTARALDQQGVRHLEPPPEPSHEALIVHLETLYPVGA